MNPILRDLPEQLETERLLIRCPRAGDGAMVHAAVVETLAELRAWPASLPWAMAEPTVDASELFCREGRAAYLQRLHLPMLLLLKDGGDYVGGSGLHHIDWATPKFELGYWCRRRFQGQGLIGEAARAITAFAIERLGARRVTCLPDAANQPSRRVAERAGFLLEAVMRHERTTPDGTLRDTCLYARIA
ncbi:GNAT family protein [Ideonella sp.]|uniref:GNAT family N-acetyltransferase n=1 Tax=Ideonella sp. TaxID=1929293 RepID=UPI002B47DD70|nr:GNAT family protein [Ideonella sp.]HJV67842.1 GNAT family protein [Ideonella sp.]